MIFLNLCYAKFPNFGCLFLVCLLLFASLGLECYPAKKLERFFISLSVFQGVIFYIANNFDFWGRSLGKRQGVGGV